jgi:hypothetical protein
MANVRALSAPSSRDIYSVPSPYAGNPVGPGVMNMGIASAASAYAGSSWDPRGAPRGRDVAGMARRLGFGEAPISTGSISLKSFDFISQQYICPPINDGADTLLMPEMLCFCSTEIDLEEGTTLVLSVAKLNKLMADQWSDFLLATTGDQQTNPHYDHDAVEFLQAMREYGERGLEDYAHSREHKQKSELILGKLHKELGGGEAAGGKDVISLRDFWVRSTQPGYCYLTRYGILQRINFAGVVLNVNRAVSVEDLDQTAASDHYSNVAVVIAKRARCANVFGDAVNITTGSKVWITLTRKHCGGGGKYGAFVLRPGGSRFHEYPLASELRYTDEAGMVCPGYHWKVGKVTEPGDRSPQPYAMEQACNTGHHASDKASYDAHGSIPSIYLALGFCH